MQKSKEIIRNNFRQIIGDRVNIDSQYESLLDRMGVGRKLNDIPLFIENAIEQVINPYLIYKFDCEKGIAKDIILEEISLYKKIRIKDYWSEWCEHWLWNFRKLPLDYIKNKYKN